MRKRSIHSCECNINNRTPQVQVVMFGNGTHRQQHATCETDSQQTRWRKLLSFPGKRAIDRQRIVMWLFYCGGMLIAVIPYMQSVHGSALISANSGSGIVARPSLCLHMAASPRIWQFVIARNAIPRPRKGYVYVWLVHPPGRWRHGGAGRQRGTRNSRRPQTRQHGTGELRR